jgi:quinol monooxygenase YgiN
MILSIVKIDASAGQGHTVIDVLESIKGQTSATPGCLGCLLTVEVGVGNTICYQEQWCDRETLEKHLRSILYTRVLAAMELSCTQPLVEFFEVTKTGGLELVETIRKPQLYQKNDE